MRRPLRALLVLAAATAVPVLALRAEQAPAPAQPARPADGAATQVSNEIVERIKEEEAKHSQVMATLSYMTDVIGPRLTGSPGMKRANEWTRDRLAAWGLKNAHLEAWGPFGRGWTLKRFSAQVIEPQCIPLIAYPKAWSPGTDGTLAAPVIYFDAKSEADFARFKGKIKGAIVLTAPVREIAAHFEPLGARKTDSELLELADADEPAPRGGRGGPNRAQTKGQPPAGGPQPAANAARCRAVPVNSRTDRPDGAGRQEDEVRRRRGRRDAGRGQPQRRWRYHLRPVRLDPRRHAQFRHGRRARRPGPARSSRMSMTRTPPRSRPRSSWPRSSTTAWSA